MGQVLRRLIGCQGSIQLVTALSAMAQREEEQKSQDLSYENYLAIYSLYAPGHQAEEFAQVIQRMAETIYTWKKIVYLPVSVTDEITQMRRFSSPRKVYQKIYQLVGVDAVDELYLGTNWQPNNQLLMNAYPRSYKICYGDGLGIYYADKPKDFNTQASIGNTITRSLGQNARVTVSLMRKFIGLGTPLVRNSFDYGYFLLPHITDSTPSMRFAPSERRYFLDILNQLTTLVDQDYADFLYKSIAGSSVAVLLGSNFSESKRMSQDSEISAYKMFLRQGGIEEKSVILVKPHPRDDHQKLEKLKVALSDIFHQVIILNQPEFFYLPFEIFFIKVLEPCRSAGNELRVFALSSACLSIKVLFDLDSHIGFGEEIVRIYFDPEFVAGRLQLEDDLKRSLTKIGQSRIPLIYS